MSNICKKHGIKKLIYRVPRDVKCTTIAAMIKEDLDRGIPIPSAFRSIWKGKRVFQHLIEDCPECLKEWEKLIK